MAGLARTERQRFLAPTEWGRGGEPKRSAGETVRGTKAAYANPRFTIIASGVGMRPRKAV